MKKPIIKIILFILTVLLITVSCADKKTNAEKKKALKEQIKQNRFCPDGYEALFNHKNLHDFEIIISGKEWKGLLKDMKDYAAKDKNGRPLTGRYRQADMIYKGPAGEAVITQVGFRTKGNYNRPFPQDDDGNFHRAHFKIKINKRFKQKEGSDAYIIRKERRFCTLREIDLRAVFQQPAGDLTQIRELFSYDLMNKAGAYASRTGSAKLTITIDGEKHYYGIFTIVEPVDKSFLTRRFGKDENDGNLYKCGFGDSGPATLEPLDEKFTANKLFPEVRVIGMKNWKKIYRPTYDLKTNEDEADHTKLISFIDQLNSRHGEDLKEYLDANFEIDRFLRYQAMNMLIGKWDDYWALGNNYFLYFNNKGKADFFTTDYDMGLGGGFMLFYPDTIGIYDWGNRIREFMQISAPQIPKTDLFKYADYSSPLTERIFKIAEYRSLYEHYLKEFITPENGIFLYSEFEKKYNLIEKLYRPYLSNDMHENIVMENKADDLKRYFNRKTKSIIRQLKLDESEYEVF